MALEDYKQARELNTDDSDYYFHEWLIVTSH